MILRQFQERSTEEEIMDDFELEGDILDDALKDIEWVNTWLGGNQVSVEGVFQWIQQAKWTEDRPIRIADLGCGGGDTLRAIATRADKLGISVQLTGIDANLHTIEFARKASTRFSNIDYLQADLLDPAFQYDDYDLVLCGLFLHHLADEELHTLFSALTRSSVSGIVINDLQRSPVAYLAFTLVSRLLGMSQMAINDGLLSIKRSFRKPELQALLNQHGLSTAGIRWKWAFRYLIVAHFPNQKISRNSQHT